MNKITLFGLLIILVSSLSGCESGNNTAVESCVSRGVAYFQEIGSYPTLSSGKNAETVARERCNRTPTAF